jgi:hypothetical protein
MGHEDKSNEYGTFYPVEGELISVNDVSLFVVTVIDGSLTAIAASIPVAEVLRFDEVVSVRPLAKASWASRYPFSFLGIAMVIEIAELAKGLATDFSERWASARELRKLLASGANLSPAVPFLLEHLLELDEEVQLIALSILIKFSQPGDVEPLINKVITEVNDRDREKRRGAADIMLAWTSYSGHERNLEKVTPQVIYMALAEAFTHKDNVLRKRVNDNFWADAWHAPNFSLVLKVLLKAYESADEKVIGQVEQTLELAAIRAKDITPAVPKLKKRLGDNGCVLAALLAYAVQNDDLATALKLIRRPEYGSYCCQRVSRIRPIQPALIEILRETLSHQSVDTRNEATIGLYYIAREGGDIALAIEALGKTLADSSKRRGPFQSVGEMAAWALAFAALGASRTAALKILDDEQFWASKNKTISKNVGIALGIIAGEIKIAPPI